LHAILIHDGLAENGHYYSYVFDSVKKQWFCYNDHVVKQVDEDYVMKEALGNSLGYKSACNLVYISSLIQK
jgi:ubiquitin carboxyl-terminal hydrolase 25/28